MVVPFVGWTALAGGALWQPCYKQYLWAPLVGLMLRIDEFVPVLLRIGILTHWIRRNAQTSISSHIENKLRLLSCFVGEISKSGVYRGKKDLPKHNYCQPPAFLPYQQFDCLIGAARVALAISSVEFACTSLRRPPVKRFFVTTVWIDMTPAVRRLSILVLFLSKTIVDLDAGVGVAFDSVALNRFLLQVSLIFCPLFSTL